MQQQQQQQSDQDSDEDLSGINFPIIDSSRRDQSTTKVSSKEDIKKSNGYDTSNNQITNTNNKGVDEDAITRCFNISVNSHMNKSDTVEVFEPMPPKKEVVSKTTLSTSDQQSKK